MKRYRGKYHNSTCTYVSETKTEITCRLDATGKEVTSTKERFKRDWIEIK